MSVDCSGPFSLSRVAFYFSFNLALKACNACGGRSSGVNARKMLKFIYFDKNELVFLVSCISIAISNRTHTEHRQLLVCLEITRRPENATFQSSKGTGPKCKA